MLRRDDSALCHPRGLTTALPAVRTRRPRHTCQILLVTGHLPAEPQPASSTTSNSSPAAGPELRMQLRGAGRFLLYASRRPAAVLLDGQAAGSVEWEERSGALSFTLPWRNPGERGGGRQAAVRF